MNKDTTRAIAAQQKKLEPVNTPAGNAGALIEEWLESKKLTRGDLARSMHITTSHLGQLINGRRLPSKPTRVLVSILTDGFVHVESWPHEKK